MGNPVRSCGGGSHDGFVACDGFVPRRTGRTLCGIDAVIARGVVLVRNVVGFGDVVRARYVLVAGNGPADCASDANASGATGSSRASRPRAGSDERHDHPTARP
jgi:hypothetical protein